MPDSRELTIQLREQAERWVDQDDSPVPELLAAADRIEELSSALRQIPDLIDSMRYAPPEMLGFWMNEILKRAHVVDAPGEGDGRT